ncbi:PIF1 [Mytilus edulis]|uniref:ATP-dependent DNA helicase n=1 Tax=Mytilus edulis TaxID=6550 RepID=A0A8S3RD32_MYTED|nr:PIF1 [Mytilus edulis]
MSLTNLQGEALNKVLEGHSLLILGQSGTGKSFILKDAAHKLMKIGKSVQKTASTGIASLNINGKTIHSWSGIADGRYSNEALREKIENNEHYAKYKQNILNTDVLFIDEISMLSKKLFEQLEFICRKIRNSNLMFGGIQVIAVGDFFQLPPVPDNLKLDAGEYCFKSEVFVQLFQHKFVLQRVMRQNQVDFINAINNISRGDLPEDTNNLLMRLSRKLPPGKDPIRLCSRNFDCDIHNSCKLIDMEGCPVMFLKNLSDKLVNGLRGNVTAVSTKIITVHFNNDIEVDLKRETFTVYSSLDNKIVASRQQFPLCLAFAITIHKSQGLTLDRVEVDASYIFAAGQLGVAVGRAKEKKGLRILGFNSKSVMRHDESLYKFYSESSITVYEKQLSCCKKDFEVSLNNIALNDAEQEIDIDDLSDFCVEEIEEIDFLLSDDLEICDPPETSPVSLETKNDINLDAISELFSGQKISPLDQKSSSSYLLLSKDNVQQFVNQLYSKIEDLFKTTCGDVSKKTLTQRHGQIFTPNCIHMPPVMIIFFLLNLCSNLNQMRSFKKTNGHPSEKHDTKSESKMSLSDGGKGKIRYIAGRCVAKCRFHHMCHAKNNLYKKDKIKSVAKSFLKVKMMDHLTKSSSDLENNSKYKSTLYETKRKQNLSQGLTNICDSMFEFILAVEEKRKLVQHDKVFHLLGSNFLKYCHSSILQDSNLFTSWRNLFATFENLNDSSYLPNDQESSESCLIELYNDIIERFCRIADNQFRKDFLVTYGKQKTERLRKRVDSKTNSSSVLTMKCINQDKSKSKISSHHKLQAVIIDHAYGIEIQCNSKKSVIKDKLCELIPSQISIVFPEHLEKSDQIHVTTEPVSTDQPSTSGVQCSKASLQTTPCTTKVRRKRKSTFMSKKKKSKKVVTQEDSLTKCPICNIIYEDGDEHNEWIACDLCDSWYNRQCSQISDELWEKIGDSDWYCPKCLQ